MMQQLLERFPGVSCAWVDAAGCVRTQCQGLADRELNIPVREDTIFPASSISKFITALCVLKLQEQHRLDIDAPVNQYLRSWKLRTPDGDEGTATIRQLLSHTAGVVDGDDAFYGLRQGDAKIALPDILEGKTTYNNRPARQEQEPGTAFGYSDAGYCILQLLVEEIAGAAFDTAAEALIFAPLGLARTFFATCENVAAHAANMAAGYDGENLPLPGKRPYQPDLAASALWSVPTELLTIGRAFIAAYKGGSAFLRAASAKEMAARAEKFPWTGLGFFMAGDDAVMSQGWGENGQCMMKMNLHTGAAAVVMTNRNPEVDQAESGVAALVDALMQR